MKRLNIPDCTLRLARSGTMSDADVQRVLSSYSGDSALMRAIGELYARLEDAMIEQAFDATNERRLMHLSRLEGAQELYRQILSFHLAAEIKARKEAEKQKPEGKTVE